MAGAELIGNEEFEQIKRLFKKTNVNLYRYGQNNFLANELEEKFSDYMDVKYAHLVSSGTAAIHSALAACEIGPGDEVITTAYTFVAPIEAIAALGAIPVPVNIDSTYHLDPNEIKKHITNKPKNMSKIIDEMFIFFLKITYIQIKNIGASNDREVILMLAPNPIATDNKKRCLNLDPSIFSV